MNTVEFMETFIKEKIIKAFALQMILVKNIQLDYVKGLSDPCITFCENDENSKKFALTNIAYWEHDLLQGGVYNISGVLYNNGKIVINEYDVRDNLKS